MDKVELKTVKVVRRMRDCGSSFDWASILNGAPSCNRQPAVDMLVKTLQLNLPVRIDTHADILLRAI